MFLYLARPRILKTRSCLLSWGDVRKALTQKDDKNTINIIMLIIISVEEKFRVQRGVEFLMISRFPR